MTAVSFDLLLATTNDGKVAELEALLADLPIRLHMLADVPEAPSVVEDRETLDGNARKKAEELAAHAGFPALADDTGLEVEALDGRPGVRTARFAGAEATDVDNRRALLAALDGFDEETERAAQFRTVVALADPDGGETHAVEGICRGVITHEERGKGGFGYDALFVPEGQPGGARETFAEMSAAAKNALSHRRRALDRMRAHLRRRLEANG